MTSKEIVLEKYPKAKCEKQVTNGGKKYYLIRPERHVMYIGSGNTEKLAWDDAKLKLSNN